MEKLLDLDARLTERMRLAEQPGVLRSLAIFFAHSADSWFWFIGLAIVWLLGSPGWKTRAVIMALSIFLTALFVLGLKFTIRRQRPEGEWGSVYRKSDPHSFPSGHAARAVLLTVLAWGFGPSWLAWLLTIWAPLVILARVMVGVHYLLDVLAGALLGALLGVGINSFLQQLSFLF